MHSNYFHSQYCQDQLTHLVFCWAVCGRRDGMVSSWQQMRERGAGQWCQLSGLVSEWDHHDNYLRDPTGAWTQAQRHSPLMTVLFLTSVTPADWAFELSRGDTQRDISKGLWIHQSQSTVWATSFIARTCGVTGSLTAGLWRTDRWMCCQQDQG